MIDPRNLIGRQRRYGSKDERSMAFDGFKADLLVLAACTTEATTLQCRDCPEIQIITVIDGDTFDTKLGRVRLYGVDIPERGER